MAHATTKKNAWLNTYLFIECLFSYKNYAYLLPN